MAGRQPGGFCHLAKKDFLISYAIKNEDWAGWIAWQLEDAGYTVTIKVWDYKPGSNIVNETQIAVTQAERTIAILSPEYMKSGYARAEWNAAFAKDPLGKERKLITIRIADFEPEGLLGQIRYIDLVGLDRAKAIKILLDEISAAVSEGGRSKPEVEPRFPGSHSEQLSKEPPYPNTTSLNTSSVRINPPLLTSENEQYIAYQPFVPAIKEKEPWFSKHRFSRDSKIISFQGYLPTYPDFTGSCSITINSDELSVLLGHEDIMNYLKNGLYTDPAFGKRKFCLKDYVNSDSFIIKLGSGYRSFSSNVANQLCMIVDEFMIQYIDELDNIEKVIESQDFERATNKHGYRLLKINVNLWQVLLQFSHEFDLDNGSSNWHIFDGGGTFIKVYSRYKTKHLDQGYHLILSAENESSYQQLGNTSNNVWVVWTPANDEGVLSHFNNRQAWTVRHAYDWLVHEFIPVVAYYHDNHQKTKALFTKKGQPLDAFKKDFHIEKYIDRNWIRQLLKVDDINTKEKLLRLTTDLQPFYHSSDQSFWFEGDRSRSLYVVLKLCLQNSALESYDYIRGNLYFDCGDTREEVLSKLDIIIEKLHDGLLTYSSIDYLLRSIIDVLKHPNTYLNSYQIKMIAKELQPLIEIKKRSDLLEKYRSNC
jgi:hypothetical protein